MGDGARASSADASRAATAAGVPRPPPAAGPADRVPPWAASAASGANAPLAWGGVAGVYGGGAVAEPNASQH